MNDLILNAAKHMDWQQVVLNQGPPCFHLCDDERFCGRAERWVGHEDLHDFIPLDKLLATLKAQRDELLQACKASLSTFKGWAVATEPHNELQRQMCDILSAAIAAVEKEGE